MISLRKFREIKLEITKVNCFHETFFKRDFTHTLWKLQKFTVTEKKFRQINYLVISLLKTLFSRNFCQKRVTVNFRNFHTVL